MNIQYLSMLSAIMLIGSGFVLAADYDYTVTDIKVSPEPEYSVQPESELGKLKGPTKLTKGKHCKTKYKDCSQFYGAEKEECEKMKKMCEDEQFAGEACFGEDTTQFRIHGQHNPYQKFNKNDLRATVYGDSKTIGANQDDPFKDISESDEILTK